MQKVTMLKLTRSWFGFLIVSVNALIVYADSVLSIVYPNNLLVPSTMILVGAIGNGAIVLLTTEQATAPSP